MNQSSEKIAPDIIGSEIWVIDLFNLLHGINGDRPTEEAVQELMLELLEIVQKNRLALQRVYLVSDFKFLWSIWTPGFCELVEPQIHEQTGNGQSADTIFWGMILQTRPPVIDLTKKVLVITSDEEIKTQIPMSHDFLKKQGRYDIGNGGPLVVSRHIFAREMKKLLGPKTDDFIVW